MLTERLNVKSKESHVQQESPWKKRLEKQTEELMSKDKRKQTA